MTKHVGIIGYPLGHSLSPRFQQAAFDALGLEVRYEAWETPPQALEERVGGLRPPSFLGANVTVPHKEAVMPLVDEIEERAQRIGAVNTIQNLGGRLKGFNTDAPGFLRALRQEGGFEPRGKKVVLLGAGGAARAVAFALLEEAVDSLTIVNRTLDRAEALAHALKPYAVGVLAWGDPRLREVLSHCQLLVNCTSLGMKHSPGEKISPLKAELIPKGALVYDVVYNPQETPLLQEAKKVGARTLGGLAMLIYQGALSFELWTGREAPIDIMFKAARRALKEG